MRLNGERYGRIKNSVCKLSERVARAWRNYEEVKELFGADRFGIGNG